MKYFLDCEFIENGYDSPIDLISIGIVAEDGREFYAIHSECNYMRANEWVWENVLIPMGVTKRSEFSWSFPKDPHRKHRIRIARDILRFIGDDPSVEFWGECCSYDWVVFCQLFGTMMDLPQGWPMRCRDVAQYLEDNLGLSQDDWPKSLETDGNHNALLGAKTVKARWEWCRAADNENIS